jgi:hypothetical protein
MAGQSGYWAALTAALPVALGHPDPAAWLSLFVACWTAPAGVAVLLGPLIDARGPRLVATVSWGVAALAAAVPAASGRAGLPVLAGVLVVTSMSFGNGMSAGETAPSWLPSRPSLAELERAGAWLNIALDLSVGIGPLAGSALAIIGTRPAWLLAGGLSLAGAGLSAMVPAVRPAPTSEPAERAPRGSRGGARAAFAATVGVLAGYGFIQIFLALYVQSVLHASYLAYGWLLGVWAVAAAITAAVAERHRWLVTGTWAMPAAAAVLAAGEGIGMGTSWLPAAVTGFVGYGIGSALFYLAARNALLAATPAARHGRVLAAWWGIQAVSMAVPALAAGALVASAGLRAALAAAPILAAITAVGTALRRPVRHQAKHRALARAPRGAAGAPLGAVPVARMIP